VQPSSKISRYHFLRSLSGWCVKSLAVLLVITYLTLFGLVMSERGLERLPAQPLQVAGETLLRTFQYITQHPASYQWQRQDVQALHLVAVTIIRSAGLLLISLGIATLLGILLGVGFAIGRRQSGGMPVLLSVIGVSTPSFLLAMLFWVINIRIHQQFNISVLPTAGFGWDAHLIMPALVLAARPLAQIAQVTYVSLSSVLQEDYIRTAQAKGLAQHLVYARHALRNALIPIITTLSTSLRFSLASLPVVEYFFAWPGVGLTLLEAINTGISFLVTDLIVSLGLLFLLTNSLLGTLYPLIEPRLRDSEKRVVSYADRQPWRAKLVDLYYEMIAGLIELRQRVKRRVVRQPSQPKPSSIEQNIQPVTMQPLQVEAADRSRPWRLLKDVIRNPALLIGTLMVLALAGLVLFGERLTPANPYELHSFMTISGKFGAPPFPPSSVFPWGTDHLGRDIQALVLAGARQTLSLALFAVIARMLLGTLLGMAAGWWQNSWIDQVIEGGVSVWAAFPFTLFAMILIQGLGIQQGMSVFIIALCIVGWGEIAQFVRGKVIGIKPKLFIEAAQSVGARSHQILTRHVFSNILDSLLVLAVLEMGGVLMLLAELGFLNVFLGGGFKVMYAEKARMVPVIAYFSDVPEWGSLLANIREWWRSYPWMAWYPGLAFFLAIMAFNLWGEGLRRFLELGYIQIGRLFNRYTLALVGITFIGFALFLRSSTPLGVYQSEAIQFDAKQAYEHTRNLSLPQMQGREAGSSGADLAALYIAYQMQSIGLFPAGDHGTFIQSAVRTHLSLAAVPKLQILESPGQVIPPTFTYRKDYVELAGPFNTYGDCSGQVIGLSTGPSPDPNVGTTFSTHGAHLGATGNRVSGDDPYLLKRFDLKDKVLLVRQAEIGRVNVDAAACALVVSDDPSVMKRKDLYEQDTLSYRVPSPVMFITSRVANQLLAPAHSSVEQLANTSAQLGTSEAVLTAPGATVQLEIDVNQEDVPHKAVVGYIAGSGSFTGPTKGQGMDRQVILVSAHYDGLGTGLDGTLFAGANDNASGVGTLLELARALKQGGYQPKKTVIFVAWPTGEQYQTLNITSIMNRAGFTGNLTVEAAIELNGVGAGSGNQISLGKDSSYRLIRLYQAAAGHFGIGTTTRGRDPHFGIYQEPGLEGRSALSLFVSWDGSDLNAHTPNDTIDTIDPQKLEKVGRSTLLTLIVLSREIDY
jgi:ABC-type dipeptide/oligopeptide/nickel transport system permease subunit